MRQDARQLQLDFSERPALDYDKILDVARDFVAPLDTYQLGEVIRWGISFTTDEDRLEAAWGEVNIQAIKRAIYDEAIKRYPFNASGSMSTRPS